MNYQSYKKRLSIILVLTVFSVSISQSVLAVTWPRLVNGLNNRICNDALKIAESTYKSESFFLYEIPPLKEDNDNTLLISPKKGDITGGNSLIIDEIRVEKVIRKRSDNLPQTIFWEREGKYNLRLILTEIPFNWQGNIYELYFIGGEVTQDSFLSKENAFRPLIESNWRPPYILQQKVTNEVWVIDTGNSVKPMSSWDIYAFDVDAVKKICTISFYPEVKSAIDLLPLEVSKLASLLKSTQGDGQNEGTSQPSVRLKIQVDYIWANAAMRPWAVTSKPYNTRNEVDFALNKWSKISPSFQKVYNDIYQQYPKAEQALTKYYLSNFSNISDMEATAMSRQILDTAFRSYFVFPK